MNTDAELIRVIHQTGWIDFNRTRWSSRMVRSHRSSRFRV